MIMDKNKMIFAFKDENIISSTLRYDRYFQKKPALAMFKFGFNYKPGTVIRRSKSNLRGHVRVLPGLNHSQKTFFFHYFERHLAKISVKLKISLIKVTICIKKILRVS